MVYRKNFWTGLFAAAGMLLLILDPKTALSGANKGIELLLRTIVPSIFPFLVLSQLIHKSFMGISIPILKPIRKLCGLPKGAESIFLLGLIGGYPVGAQSIENAYISGTLNEHDAKRLLGFCNNAGPAFIFGMASGLFSSMKTAWVLWLVHILSAIAVGALLPGKSNKVCKLDNSKTFGLPLAIEKGVKTMGQICAWVILFRIIIAFACRWFLWILPKNVEIAIIGFLELSNGCCELYAVSQEGLRFVLSSVILSLGGICVGMQTYSVAKRTGLGRYFPGKVLQGCISFFIAGVLQYILFSENNIWKIPAIVYIIAFILLVGTHCFVNFKKQ